MSQLASSANPTMRDYFEKTKLGELLERLVVDLGEERPDDVLAFIERWAGDQRRARRKSGAGAGSPALTSTRTSGTVADSGSVAEAAREVWRGAGSGAPTAVAKHFFDVLFTQHASLRRKLFSNVDVEAAKAGLAPLLSQAVLGEMDAAAIGAAAKTHGAGRGAEQKHFHYFLTAALTATSVVVGADAFGPVAEGFRVIFTGIGDAVMIGLGLKSAPDASPAAAKSLQGEWDSVADKPSAVKLMLKVLRTQHPTLQKRVLAGTDDDVIALAVADALSAALNGALSDDAIVSLGTQYGAGRQVEPRHFDYLLCAALTALQHTVGPDAFALTHENWRVKLTNVCDLLRLGACGTATSGGADAAPQLVGPGVGTAASGVVDSKEAMAALSGRSAFDVARDSWAGVSDQKQLVLRFYAVLLTQHRSLCNSVLKDIDLEDIAPTVVDLVTHLLDGAKPLSHLNALGAEHGKPRRVQLKHLHYALSAALTALGITIGETFPAVSDQWKTVLTCFVDEFAAGAACDAMTSPQEQMSISMAPVQPKEGNAAAANEAAAESVREGGGDDAAASPKDRVYSDEECLTLVRECWKTLGEQGKRRDMCDHFFSVLLTQHPTVKRRLFAGLEPDALAPLLEAQLDACIAAASFPALPDVTALAKAHGAGRGPIEMKHYHYFLSAGLAAAAIVVGRKEFAPVAEPWRRVFTHIMQAVMAGAPPVDAGAEQYHQPPAA